MHGQARFSTSRLWGELEDYEELEDLEAAAWEQQLRRLLPEEDEDYQSDYSSASVEEDGEREEPFEARRAREMAELRQFAASARKSRRRRPPSMSGTRT